MEIIEEDNFKFDKPTAVTIGKFDGIHLGHQRLLLHTEHFKKNGYIPVIFTFNIHPSLLFGNEKKQLIYTESEKEIIIGNYNIDYLIKFPFNEISANMEPEEFFEAILIRKLNAKVITVGEDFRFGHNRKGDVAMLESFAEKYGIAVDVINQQCLDNQVISSTCIRQYLNDGKIECVNQMLGNPYSIYGTVVKGNQIGRTLGMPTINLEPDVVKLLPPRGVYASHIIFDNKIYDGVTNIGVKPTIHGINRIGVESYIFDFDEEIYGEDVVVQLLSFLRPEVKFGDLALLKKQMYNDKEQAGLVIRRQY